MANPVTQYIHATEDLVTKTSTLLTTASAAEISAGGTGWGTETFSGTSEFQLLLWLPELLTKHAGKPVCVIMYGGSAYENNPRRLAKLHIICMVENGVVRETQEVTVRSLLDKVLKTLDDQTDGHMKWEIEADEPLDAYDTVAVLKLTFRVRDY